MAHETAIHRADAELAAGREPASHDVALALDGVDELLGFAASPQCLPTRVPHKAAVAACWWSPRAGAGWCR